jgi:hypothetical protein
MRRSLAVNLITVTGFTIVGLIAGPFIADMLSTPNRLVNHLENGEVEEFNKLRQEFKQQIS